MPPCGASSRGEGPLHYITLHYITLHYITCCSVRRPSQWSKRDALHQDMHAAMRGHGTAAPSSARAVEAGAVILTAPRGATSVVLQMPRGNLEAVNHRVLVMALISNALQVQPF